LAECFDCDARLGMRDKRYNVKLGKSAYPVCFKCSACVICRIEPHPGARQQPLPIGHSARIVSILVFCPQHAHIAFEVSGLPVVSWPEYVLRAVYAFLVVRRDELMASRSKVARAKLPFQNRLMEDIKQRLNALTRASIPPSHVGRVKCEYCGTRQLLTAHKCDSCGAPL
jgi:hypothetical protein